MKQLEAEVKRLFRCLNEQINFYRELFDLALEKQEVIIANNLEGLNCVLKRENELVADLLDLENQRLEMVECLASRLGLFEPNSTITKILAGLEGELKQEGEILVDELSSLLTRLSDLNRTNGELLEHSLCFINYSLQLFTEGGRRGRSYGSDGKMPDEQQKINVLDQKA